MKTLATLLALPALAFALAGPAHAADNTGTSSDNPQSSNGYKYDRSMNSGGVAGGSTQTRDTYKAQQQQRQKGDSSNGYQYDRSMNSGGRAGGSTVPQAPRPAQ